MSADTDRSKIYPGIPEYFDSEGRGMYHYLTGSASWLVLTELTQVFGVRGHYGDLVLAPQLVKEQFNAKGIAQVRCQFAGHTITVEYHNPRKLDAGQYRIKEVLVNSKSILFDSLSEQSILIKREQIPHSLAFKVILT